VGIQTFSRLRRERYVYVDKTDMVWLLAQENNPFLFFARPRRFGKSLLASTLHSFFAGERELFRGLKVDELEWDWKHYPVLHFDLSGAKHLPPQGVRDELGRQLKIMEEQYGADPAETSPGMRFAGVVNRAFKKTNLQVAIIIDEYDAPLLDVLHEEEQLHDMREVLQEFYQRLKMLEPMIKFCFITGITKFSQLSIFSTINNITVISMLPKYAALCGITEEELITTLAPDIAMLAEANDCTPEEMHQRLKNHYDGYKFSRKSPEIYNPFSLFKAFDLGEVGDYWFDSGTPAYLVRQMKKYGFENFEEPEILFPDSFCHEETDLSDITAQLFECGYLSIADHIPDDLLFLLRFPNRETKESYDLLKREITCLTTLRGAVSSSAVCTSTSIAAPSMNGR